MWQTVERKGKFIDQVMHGDLTTREAEDISSDQSLSFNEVKALASGNPLLLEKAQADQELAKLQNLEKAHRTSQVAVRGALERAHKALTGLESRIPRLQEAIAAARPTKGDDFRLSLPETGQTFTDRVEASNALRERLLEAGARARAYSGETIPVRGLATVGGLTFDATVENTLGSTRVNVHVQGLSSDVFQRQELNSLVGQGDSYGLVTRLENMVSNLPSALEKAEAARSNAVKDKATAQEAIGKPFSKSAELDAARERVAELSRQLSGERESDTHQEETAVETREPLPLDAASQQEEQAGRSQDEINREGTARLRAVLHDLREKKTPVATPHAAGRGRQEDWDRESHHQSGPGLRR